MSKCIVTLITCPYTAGGRSRWGSGKAGTTVQIRHSEKLAISPLYIRCEDQSNISHNTYYALGSHLSIFATLLFKLCIVFSEFASSKMFQIFRFGSKVLGPKTGIIFNSMMQLFTLTQKKGSFNHIEAKKRGQSPFAPIIVIDDEEEVVLVAGASGGLPTITSTSFVSTSVEYQRSNIV